MKDFVSVVRRFPNIPIVWLALVQGKDAPQSIVQALAGLNICDEIDVVVLARGRPSRICGVLTMRPLLEAIAACRFPVVSAVGRETDVTIADLVADLQGTYPFGCQRTGGARSSPTTTSGAEGQQIYRLPCGVGWRKSATGAGAGAKAAGKQSLGYDSSPAAASR